MNFKRILGIALFIAIPIARSWSSHVIRFLSAIWIAIPFYAFGGNTLLVYALIGALINMILSACIYSAYEEALYSLEGIRDFFLASPLSRFEFRAGLSLGIFITTIPSMLVCLVLLIMITKPSVIEILELVLLIIALWIFSTLIGYLVPIKRNILETGNIIRVITIVLIALPPVYYPISVWPEQLRFLAYAIPTFIFAELMRVILGVINYTIQYLETLLKILVLEAIVIATVSYLKSRTL